MTALVLTGALCYLAGIVTTLVFAALVGAGRAEQRRRETRDVERQFDELPRP